MIRVYYSQSGSDYELTIEGHAGYAAYGSDIVCAAVSAVAFSLLGFLTHYSDEIYSLEGPETEPGGFFVNCSGTERIEAAFHMAAIGLEKISNKYPDYVDFTYSVTDGDSREQTAGKEHGAHAEQ